jgi:hypothetical protein
MRLLDGFRRKWTELRDEEQREFDERQRLLQLLAYRDAFLAMLLLVCLVMAVQMYVLSRSDVGPARAVALLPMQAIFLASLVFFASWRARGGGFPRRVAAFKTAGFAIGIAVGTLFAFSISLSLQWAGFTRPRSLSSYIAYVTGLAIAMAIIFFAQSRKKPTEQ